MNVEPLVILSFVFLALSWGWNVVQAYQFIQDKFRPPEEREQFDGQKALMLQELYTDMIDARGSDEYEHESGQILREIHTRVDALHAVHEATDQDGVRLCYVPRSLHRDVRRLLRRLEHPSSSEGTS